MINKATLVGRLGADPEVRYMPDGAMVVNMRIATDENWKNKAGEKVTKTEWHRIVIFGKLAEIAGKFLTKGRLIYVEGRIQTRKWEKDGHTNYTTEVIALVMKMLDSQKTNGAAAPPANGGVPPAADPQFDGTIPEEDVPF